MQHSGALACTEKEAPCHRPLCQGGGDEAPKAGGGGAAVEYGECLPVLWGTVKDGHLV